MKIILSLTVVIIVALFNACDPNLKTPSSSNNNDIGGGTDNNTNLNCGSDHFLVGSTANLSTLQHGVSGTAEVISDCQIKLTNFNFDGGGIVVYVWGALDSDFDNGVALSQDLKGTPLTDAELTVDIPAGMTLDDINSLSIWCEVAGLDFGSLQFQ